MIFNKYALVITFQKYQKLSDPTVGVDFFARIIEVKDGTRIKLQLWDTAVCKLLVPIVLLLVSQKIISGSGAFPVNY